MSFETFTFGTLTNIYTNIFECKEKNKIAHFYGIPVAIFESWLKSLNFVRNCCAHHSRLWNRKIPLKPTLPSRKNNAFLKNIDYDTNKRMYGTLSCILYLMQTINPKSSFKEKIKSLFAEYPEINISHMGFPKDWEKENLWENDVPEGT